MSAGKTREAPKLQADEAGLVLVIQLGNEAWTRPVPREGVLEIGRDEASDVLLDDDSVSRRHARLHCDSNGVDLEVEDCGSTNGTRVLGEPLAAGARRRLAAGAVLEFGSVVVFVRPGRAADVVPAGPAMRRSGASSARAAAKSDAGVVVADPRMKELYALLDVVAPSPFPVLVLGETGVGKDVYAETIHRRSPRADGPFLRLNCAALAESILESELFGHEKGAFTGAVAAKPGLFEAAHGGTVFLDEVGELPLSTQAKLLRVLENGEVMRLGSVRTLKVDVRFVSATNRDLQALAARQQFRTDLYFRLSGVVVTIPPLRERPADVEALAEHFVAEASRRLGRPVVTISSTARARLAQSPWAGNIRELRNTLERAVLVCRGGVLEASHLETMAAAAGRASSPPPMVADVRPPAAEPSPVEPARGAALSAELREIQKNRILEALEACAGNQTRAAKMLGMPRRSLLRRIDEYGLARPRKRDE
jgi:transcriptional regulator with GAF, ATPase, and Fis domain